MPRLNIERQKALEPKRVQLAKKEIERLGFSVIIENEILIKFVFKNSPVLFYPYSGWHSGKTIKDGRGLKNLLKQIKEKPTL